MARETFPRLSSRAKRSVAKDLNPSTSALQILPPYGRLNDKENNVHFLHVNGVKKPVPFYNLDVLLNDLRKHTLPKKIWIECCKCLHLQKQIINKNKDKGHG